MIRHAIVGICVALLCVASCGQSGEERARVSFAQERVAVIPASKTELLWAYLSGCSGTETEGLAPAWTPEVKTIERLDPIIRAAVDSAASLTNAQVRASDFRIQYYGVYRDSVPLLVANGLHDRLFASDSLDDTGSAGLTTRLYRIWSETITIPCDVGSAYFRVTADTMGHLRPSVRFGGSM